ncbi:hypothetical protein [Planctomicrobium piriforme]|uniref:Uncharacterized protein n=1 Tax=Planctomicrobium piriforme TaxID=1576369 RepID=A0A1I3EJ35_9PLAN|nr:hypothetical protein [Planctomicrobium piriforme]SFH98908.1 hypothetical protein SAMN05421753_104243 [Planctomicrobium piriforme]
MVRFEIERLKVNGLFVDAVSMNEQTPSKRRFRLPLVIFAVWLVTLIFATLTAQAALQMPGNKPDSITTFVRSLVSPAILFWPWVASAVIAYLIGPLAVAIAVVLSLPKPRQG